MAITKEKKVEIVKTLTERIKGATAVVFVNFHGLSVTKATELRKSLRAQNTGLMVAKKTLLRRAFADSQTVGECPELTGEIALAYSSTDPLVSARGIYEFEKKNKELVKIVGGIFEGKFADGKMMLALATIPSREVLLSKLANILNSPIQRLVIALNQISKTKQV